MKTKAKPKHFTEGFSLQEMLIVIAIIGIVSLIALPIITSFKAQAQEAVAKRNAQMLAQAAASASAVGNNRIANAKSKPAAIAFLVDGVTVDQYDNAIGVPGLSPEEQWAASSYLSYKNGSLRYCEGGSANLSVDQQGDDDGEDYNENGGGGRWAAQVLAGAAAGVSDPSFAQAGGVGAAINLLRGGLGGPTVMNLPGAQVQQAQVYLDWQNNTLVYRPN